MTGLGGERPSDVAAVSRRSAERQHTRKPRRTVCSTSWSCLSSISCTSLICALSAHPHTSIQHGLVTAAAGCLAAKSIATSRTVEPRTELRTPGEQLLRRICRFANSPTKLPTCGDCETKRAREARGVSADTTARATSRRCQRAAPMLDMLQR